MRIFVTFLWLGLALLAAPTTHAGGSPCESLDQAVRAATEEQPFSTLIGPDNGLFQETTLELPGSKLCMVHPDSRPTPSWRCLLGGEARYTAALEQQGALGSEIESCLGQGWTREEPQEPDFLAVTRFTRGTDGVQVRVTASKKLEPDHGWKSYRMVVGVWAPAR